MTPIVPEWPAPRRVKALFSTRSGGVSLAPYASLNLGSHVGDEATAVQENRRRVARHMPSEPFWLEQVHGTKVLRAGSTPTRTGDAVISSSPSDVCVVMVADCLPVLFCDRAGTVVGAAHAGWRGLADGVLEATIGSLEVEPGQLLAWLGPAIGPAAFEVGPEVRERFLSLDPEAGTAFRSGRDGRWMADIFALARQRLVAAGVATNAIYGGGVCTVSDPERFFSFRRDGQTGRMAAFIWLED